MKLLYIEWCDATSKVGPWVTKQEAIDWADSEHWVVKCVGWVVKETKEYLLLCQQMSPTDDYTQEQLGTIYKIPKTWIRVKKYLLVKETRT